MADTTKAVINLATGLEDAERVTVASRDRAPTRSEMRGGWVNSPPRAYVRARARERWAPSCPPCEQAQSRSSLRWGCGTPRAHQMARSAL
jgi:hypothetical protein